MFQSLEYNTKLLLVVEKNVILVVCSRLSNIVYFVTTTIERILAEDLARLFRDKDVTIAISCFTNVYLVLDIT